MVNEHLNNCAELLVNLRPVLRYNAYRICGNTEDAEDIIQDTYIKFLSVSRTNIENPRAYLTRMTVNAAINQKQKISRQQSVRIQNNLPLQSAPAMSDYGLIRKEIFLKTLHIILSCLNSFQQAVFILKEGYDYSHDELAGLLNISAEVSRQNLSRAKKRISTSQTSRDKAVSKELLAQYLHVLQSGDRQRIEQLLIEKSREPKDIRSLAA